MSGRSRQYSSPREATRVRTARWRARIQNKQTEEPQDSYSQFQNTFLSFDPRAVPAPPRIEYSHWTVLDDLRESLDAAPITREIGTPRPVDAPREDQPDASSPPRPRRPRAESEASSLNHDLTVLPDPLDDTIPLIRDETTYAGRTSKHYVPDTRTIMTDKETLTPLGTLSHPHNPEPPSAVLPPSHATPNAEHLPPATELAISTRSWNEQLSPEPLAIFLADQLEHPYSCNHEITSPTPNPSPVTPNTSTVSLSTLVQWSCPDILGIDGISQHPLPWDELIPPAMRRQVFTGIAGEPPYTLVHEQISPHSNYSSPDCPSCRPRPCSAAWPYAISTCLRVVIDPEKATYDYVS